MSVIEIKNHRNLYKQYIYSDLLFFSVQKSIELISKAKRPLILVGSQATLPPVPAEELRKSLEVVLFFLNFHLSVIVRLLELHLSMQSQK